MAASALTVCSGMHVHCNLGQTNAFEKTTSPGRTAYSLQLGMSKNAVALDRLKRHTGAVRGKEKVFLKSKITLSGSQKCCFFP